jgi:DNA repair protein RadC
MAKKKAKREFSAITDWPEHERPRERLLKHGANSLSDAELLAILLRTGTHDNTAVDIARTLLERCESLERLSSRTVADLRHHGKNLGLGLAKAAAIVAAFEIGRRAAVAYNKKRERINSPEEVAQKYIPSMRDKKQESFYVILLDSANHILRDEKISEGILNSSLVHPREVFKPAIIEPAASIILLHNHPSGNPEPSSEDLQITRQLLEASKIVGIPIHDHIIIAGNSYTSFAERGIL